MRAHGGGVAMAAMSTKSLLTPEPIDFDVTWAQLKVALEAVLKDLGAGFPNDLWMKLYSNVYYLCTKPLDPQHHKLYWKLKDLLEEYVDGVKRRLVSYDTSTGRSHTELLVRYRDAFENYSTGMKYASELFSYLDRHWIKTNHCEKGRLPRDGVYYVYELALIIWRDRLFSAIKTRLRTNIIMVIDSARERNMLDLGTDGVVKAVLATYETLGFEKRDRSQLFQRELEDFIVEDTRAYFTRRSCHILQYMPVPRYLKEVERYLAEEASRCTSFVGSYTARRILIAAQEALIVAHAERLVEESKAMLAAQPEQQEDLLRLYTLISYLDDGDPHAGSAGETANPSMLALQQVVREHIRCEGLRVVRDLQAAGGGMDIADEDSFTPPQHPLLASGGGGGAAAVAMVLGDDVGPGGASGSGRVTSDDVVEAMLKVHEHYKRLVAESFKDSAGFRLVLDEACKAFVNAVPRAPEWLARYAHCLLDKGFKEAKVDDATRDIALDRVGFLFTYIADKDIFHRYYSKLLSKRIIQLTSVSDEAEERMLANMRRISGFEYTSKLQRMFVDKALSTHLHTGYVEWQERRMLRCSSLYSEDSRDSTRFTFTDEEDRASRALEEVSVSGSACATGHDLNSPPLSPMYFSPKGLSPRMNILPSFAWGKTMLKHLKRRPPPSGSARGGTGGHVRGGGSSGLAGGEAGGAPSFEAFTFVLTAGCWPLQSVSSTFKPPGPVEDYVESFLEYYGEKHSGRRLEWLYHLGHGEMVTGCYDRPYRVYSSTFQMGVLYQFNAVESLTVAAIAEGIRISETEIVRHLFPLVKAGLLIVRTTEPVLSCDDLRPEQEVCVNPTFSSKRSRVKVNIVDHSRQPSKIEAPPPEVLSDRKMSVQAAVCRIMKARKECEHKALLKEVCSQLQHLFVPEAPFIKANIEELIEKDYLARVAGKESYMYIA